jgi:hypothetical protein
MGERDSQISGLVCASLLILYKLPLPESFVKSQCLLSEESNLIAVKATVAN